jgi:hypothetical protein
MADSINDPSELALAWADLALALSVLRDNLTELSFSMSDYIFELDMVRRLEAVQIAQQLSEKIRGQVEQSRRP